MSSRACAGGLGQFRVLGEWCALGYFRAVPLTLLTFPKSPFTSPPLSTTRPLDFPILLTRSSV